MARSSTTIKPGQALAMKHGAYSASNRLADQNRTLALAAQRLQADKLTPLQLQVYRTLRQTIKRQTQVSGWLNKLGNPGNPISAKGERLKEWITLEAALQKSVHLQTMALWKMLLAVPTEQQLSVDDARSYLAQYGAEGPEGPQPPSLTTPPAPNPSAPPAPNGTDRPSQPASSLA